MRRERLKEERKMDRVTISNLLSIFIANIFLVSFIRTKWTSPKAPLPITFINWKSCEDNRLFAITGITDSSKRGKGGRGEMTIKGDSKLSEREEGEREGERQTYITLYNHYISDTKHITKENPIRQTLTKASHVYMYMYMFKYTITDQ